MCTNTLSKFILINKPNYYKGKHLIIIRKMLCAKFNMIENYLKGTLNNEIFIQNMVLIIHYLLVLLAFIIT